MNETAVNKPKRETICIGVYIPVELHNDISKLAKEMELNSGVRHTLSDVVRLAVKEFISKKD